MTPEHIETIIAVHNFFDVPPKEYRDAIDALRVDHYRMRQPITPEALRADGWEVTDEERFDDSPRACSQTYAPPFTDGALYFLAVRMKWSTEDDTGTVAVVMHGEDDDIKLLNVTNMHDLRELVRLLGGKPDSAS